jgi:hypothetical protein
MSATSIAKAANQPLEPRVRDMEGATLDIELSGRLRRVGLRPTRPRMLLLRALHESKSQGLPLLTVEKTLADDGNGVSHSSLLNSLRELAYKRLIVKAPGQPVWLKVAEVIWLDTEYAELS